VEPSVIPTERTSASVSIIIPLYDGATTIDEQLASIATQAYAGPWEVVVADNGSRDDGVQRVRAWTGRFPELKIVDASDAPGPAHARNAGARQATGDLLLFCDADDAMGDGWLGAMVEALDRYDLVGGAVEISVLNPPPICYWGSPVPAGENGTDGDAPPHAIGSNFGIRRTVFEAIGGFSEEYTMACSEDVDICWKAVLAGFQQGFAPNAVVHRRFRTTLRGLARQHYEYGRSHAQLYANFRGQWAPRSLREAAKAWGRLVKHAPDLLKEETRGLWIRDAAMQTGRLAGCMQHRVFIP
jgi:GT2 family glycosyltransferase